MKKVDNFIKERESNLSDRATKSDSFLAGRWIEEESDAFRSPFQCDVGYILYSNPFRRLRTKTQVFTNPEDQHNRTRLTHSLEVAHIARQIARTLRLNEDLTEAIALGHDLGHTPFGHAGERALDEMLKDLGGFGHNVQSVWIVERCFQGRVVNGKKIPGLNLTFGVREGILKHTEIEACLDSQDLAKFNLDKPASLEGQVVDIADGIAYLRHDIEDGLRNEIVGEWDMEEVFSTEGIRYDSKWADEMIMDVINNSYDKDGIDFSQEMKSTYKALKKWVKDHIIKSPLVQKSDQTGYEMVCELYQLLLKYPELLPGTSENSYKLEKHGLERTIADYIQWLGDQNFKKVLDGIRDKVK